MAGDRVQAAPSVRAFIAGNSGSGKTTLAQRMYLSKYPRVIILDLTGEWEDKVDATAYTVPDLVQWVRETARTRGKWRVALALDKEELPALVGWLVPVPEVKRSPILAVGGAALLVDEVDLLAPPGTSSEPIRTLYRRSRHVGLTVVSTTQRPANVSREVSAQSTHAVALTLNENRDVDYMTRLMRWEVPQVQDWQRWTRQHRHGGVWRDLQTGQQLWIPESGPPTSQGPKRAQTELPPPVADGDGE
jgi:hypothetical protein